MKVTTTSTSIRLTPESQEDKEALHNAAYRGVTSARMIGLSQKNDELLMTLGPDTIAESRQDASLQAEESDSLLQAGNQLLGLGLGQGHGMPVRAAVVYLFDRPGPKK